MHASPASLAGNADICISLELQHGAIRHNLQAQSGEASRIRALAHTPVSAFIFSIHDGLMDAASLLAKITE
jgi:hypothetical protein